MDAAFLAEFGFPQSSPSAANITSAQMDAFVAGTFANEFSPANWSANWSSASNQNRSMRIDQSQVVEIPLNANMQPLRDLASAITLALDGGTGNLSQGTFQTLVDKATALCRQGGRLASAKCRRCSAMCSSRSSSARERIESRNNILQKEINALEGVDPYEAATRVNIITNQLEASYALTARHQPTEPARLHQITATQDGTQTMQHALYAEVQDDCRRTLRATVSARPSTVRSACLKRRAQQARNSRDALDALHYLDRLWSLLLEDLAHAENQLPRELRASLISIGIWILREIEQIRTERSSNFGGLIDVSQMISNGLGGRA